MNIGHQGRIQLNPDNGKRVAGCFHGGGPSQLHGGTIIGQADGGWGFTDSEGPVSARQRTEVGQAHMSGRCMKECMTGPSPRSHDPKPITGNWMFNAEQKERKDNTGMSPAGCGAWGSPQTAQGKTLFVKPDTAHVMPRNCHLTTQAESQKILNDYYKFCFGRSMRTNRSEPPKRICKNPQGWWVQEGWSSGGKMQCGNDHSKDDSLGKIVPAVEKSNRRSESEVKYRCKAEGAYSRGVSDFAEKLCIRANMQTLRMENFDNSSLGKRHTQMLHTPRSTNCISPGPEDYGEPPRRGRSPSPLESPAGLTTRELSRTLKSHTPIEAMSTGDTGNMSRQMEGALKHSVDARALRAHREENERPFVDLCTAFAQIRQTSLKDSQRIRDLVNPQSSRQFHSLMWWPDENQNTRSKASGSGRFPSSAGSGYDTPSDMPGSPASWTAGDSPGSRNRRSGKDSARSTESLVPDGQGGFYSSPKGRHRQKHYTGCFSPSFTSHDVATALKWVC